MSFQRSNERVIVDVWDWETRVLHWINMLLVITLAVLMLGAEALEELGAPESVEHAMEEFHAVLGYFFVATLALRIIWGFAGNSYARWSDIIPYNGERWRAIGQNVKWYLSGFTRTPARVVGHDPLASLFYIALFIVLILQAVSGLALAGIELDMFPGSAIFGGLGEHQAEEFEEVFEEIHEFGLWFIIFFIAAHLVGLVVHELKEKTGLFSSMIHGKKYLPKE